MHDRTTTIFEVDDRFTWLREPLLARLPDGSLCCAFFTGGGHDGDRRNVIAAIRSDNDGATWSAPEILKQLPDQSAWAPSMIGHGDHAHIFWFSSRDGHRYRKVNHLLSTGADGRTFTENREILTGWNGPRGVDIRHGTVLRDGCVLLPIAWMEPIGDFDPDTWVDPGTNTRYGNFGWGGIAQNNHYCVGVMEANADFTEFIRHGRVFKAMPEWEIPGVPFFENAIADLGDGQLAMLIRADLTNRLWRTDSRDGGMRNWSRTETLVAAPALAQYPDGCFDPDPGCIYLVWEDDRTISFRKLSV